MSARFCELRTFWTTIDTRAASTVPMRKAQPRPKNGNLRDVQKLWEKDTDTPVLEINDGPQPKEQDAVPNQVKKTRKKKVAGKKKKKKDRRGMREIGSSKKKSVKGKRRGRRSERELTNGKRSASKLELKDKTKGEKKEVTTHTEMNGSGFDAQTRDEIQKSDEGLEANNSGKENSQEESAIVEDIVEREASEKKSLRAKKTEKKNNVKEEDEDELKSQVGKGKEGKDKTAEDEEMQDCTFVKTSKETNEHQEQEVTVEREKSDKDLRVKRTEKKNKVKQRDDLDVPLAKPKREKKSSPRTVVEDQSDKTTDMIKKRLVKDSNSGKAKKSKGKERETSFAGLKESKSKKSRKNKGKENKASNLIKFWRKKERAQAKREERRVRARLSRKILQEKSDYLFSYWKTKETESLNQKSQSMRRQTTVERPPRVWRASRNANNNNECVRTESELITSRERQEKAKEKKNSLFYYWSKKEKENAPKNIKRNNFGTESTPAVRPTPGIFNFWIKQDSEVSLNQSPKVQSSLSAKKWRTNESELLIRNQGAKVEKENNMKVEYGYSPTPRILETNSATEFQRSENGTATGYDFSGLRGRKELARSPRNNYGKESGRPPRGFGRKETHGVTIATSPDVHLMPVDHAQPKSSKEEKHHAKTTDHYADPKDKQRKRSFTHQERHKMDGNARSEGEKKRRKSFGFSAGKWPSEVVSTKLVKKTGKGASRSLSDIVRAKSNKSDQPVDLPSSARFARSDRQVFADKICKSSSQLNGELAEDQQVAQHMDVRRDDCIQQEDITLQRVEVSLTDENAIQESSSMEEVDVARLNKEDLAQRSDSDVASLNEASTQLAEASAQLIADQAGDVEWQQTTADGNAILTESTDVLNCDYEKMVDSSEHQVIIDEKSKRDSDQLVESPDINEPTYVHERNEGAQVDSSQKEKNKDINRKSSNVVVDFDSDDFDTSELQKVPKPKRSLMKRNSKDNYAKIKSTDGDSVANSDTSKGGVSSPGIRRVLNKQASKDSFAKLNGNKSPESGIKSSDSNSGDEIGVGSPKARRALLRRNTKESFIAKIRAGNSPAGDRKRKKVGVGITKSFDDIEFDSDDRPQTSLQGKKMNSPRDQQNVGGWSPVKKRKRGISKSSNLGHYDQPNSKRKKRSFIVRTQKGDGDVSDDRQRRKRSISHNNSRWRSKGESEIIRRSLPPKSQNEWRNSSSSAVVHTRRKAGDDAMQVISDAERTNEEEEEYIFKLGEDSETAKTSSQSFKDDKNENKKQKLNKKIAKEKEEEALFRTNDPRKRTSIVIQEPEEKSRSKHKKKRKKRGRTKTLTPTVKKKDEGVISFSRVVVKEDTMYIKSAEAEDVITTYEKKRFSKRASIYGLDQSISLRTLEKYFDEQNNEQNLESEECSPEPKKRDSVIPASLKNSLSQFTIHKKAKSSDEITHAPDGDKLYSPREKGKKKKEDEDTVNYSDEEDEVGVSPSILRKSVSARKGREKGESLIKNLTQNFIICKINFFHILPVESKKKGRQFQQEKSCTM